MLGGCVFVCSEWKPRPSVFVLASVAMPYAGIPLYKSAWESVKAGMAVCLSISVSTLTLFHNLAVAALITHMLTACLILLPSSAYVSYFPLLTECGHSN